MPARRKPLNLLPQSDFEQSFLGKFLQWTITTGRGIVIVTELVVILAFLSRFKLDQDLLNLTNRIDGQKNFLDSQASVENDFRLTQARVNRAKALSQQQIKPSELMDTLVSAFPPQVKMQSMRAEPGKVGFRALTLSERSLAELLLRLTKQEKWKSMEITDFTNDTGSAITFNLDLYY